MHLRQFLIEGLGHISALVADDSKGVAAVIDPRRDIDVYLEEARSRDLRITHVVETHLHNDYVSGARELAQLTGAVHVIGFGAELAHDFHPVGDGDFFDVGSLRFTVLDTPGHTPEHVSYALADRSRGDDAVLLFTGGSLLVGAVGRTDLLGAENAEPFARRQFASLHEKLLVHDDHVGVHPTHGGGSLCSKDISTTPSSTIGYERRHQDLLRVEEVDAFVTALLTDQPPFPPYFRRMRPINQAGPAPLGSVPAPVPLPLARVRELLGGDHLLVDLRSPAAHAVAHVPGSISIPAASSFGTWLGWMVPHDRPLVLLLDSGAQWDDAVRQALRIGHEGVVGYLQGGFLEWEGSGAPIQASDQLTVRQLRDRLASHGDGNGRAGAAATGNGRGPGSSAHDAPPLVLDVRARDEYERGHLPGSLNLYAGELPERLDELSRDRPVVAICASGYRSSIAASVLQSAGFRDVGWVSGGVPAWRSAGFPIETGEAAAIRAPTGAKMNRRPVAEPAVPGIESSRQGGSAKPR